MAGVQTMLLWVCKQGEEEEGLSVQLTEGKVLHRLRCPWRACNTGVPARSRSLWWY